MLNHIPILGAIFLALLLGFALWRNDPGIQRLTLASTILVALLTIPVYLTGEPAEDAIEHSAGFTEDMVEQHEERGEITLIVVLVTGAAALGTLVLARGGKALRPALVRLVLLGLVASSGIAAWTALDGGQIRHPELRPGWSPPSATPEHD
jgi:hypothetical protein